MAYQAYVYYNTCKIADQNRNKDLEQHFRTCGMCGIKGSRTGSEMYFDTGNVYLSKVPTFDKKTRVFLDWIIDLFFDRDVSRLNYIKRETEKEYKLLDEVDDLW